MKGLRQARRAASWLRQNAAILKGTVTEPLILGQADNEIMAKIYRQTAAGFTFLDLRDDLLFDFTNMDDVRLFLSEVREGMDCAAHVCLNGKDYLQNKLL
jgi:hypothetical protein